MKAVGARSEGSDRDKGLDSDTDCDVDIDAVRVRVAVGAQKGYRRSGTTMESTPALNSQLSTLTPRLYLDSDTDCDSDSDPDPDPEPDIDADADPDPEPDTGKTRGPRIVPPV